MTVSRCCLSADATARRRQVGQTDRSGSDAGLAYSYNGTMS